jgi:hypothetical protein
MSRECGAVRRGALRRELTRFVLDGHAALLDEMAGAPGLADPAQHDDVAVDGLARDGQAGRPAALGRSERPGGGGDTTCNSRARCARLASKRRPATPAIM